MSHRSFLGAVAALGLALLSACAESPAPTQEPSPSTTEATTSEASAPSSTDRTDALKKLTGPEMATLIESATLEAPSELGIQSRLVDPRDQGSLASPEAVLALNLCRDGMSLLQDAGVTEPRVRVYEENGSTFAASRDSECERRD